MRFTPIYGVSAFKIFILLLGRISVPLALIAIIGCVGILGFMTIEDFNLQDALYMTVITISTTGFGEIHPLSAEGRMFTSLLIISSIGIFTYSVTAFTQSILDGEIRRFFTDYRVNMDIEKLRNHVVVCGYGRNGRQVCEELHLEGKAFVVIENGPEHITKLRREGRYLFIEGDATLDETLMNARVHFAKALVTTLPRDSDNVFVALSARQLNTHLTIISRASNESAEQKLIRAGCNHVIMPERISGSHMARLVTRPEVIEFISLISGIGNSDVFFEELMCDNLVSVNQNCSIRDLQIREATGVNVIGFRLQDGSYIVNPPPDTPINPGSMLIVLGNLEQITKLRKLVSNTQ